MLLAGVQALPAGVAWQLAHSVAPVWFMVNGSQAVPMVWQLAQVLAVIGAVAWLAGRPVADVPLWQVVQSVAAVMLLCLNEVGVQAVVVWQLEHCA